MAENDNDASKIIVDDDWKTQAQAEKEKLAAKAKAEAEAAPAQPGQAGAPGEAGPQKLPPASFSTLANMLLTNCVMALGGMEDPKTKKRFVDLAVAKFYIDNMEVLQISRTSSVRAADELRPHHRARPKGSSRRPAGKVDRIQDSGVG